MPALKRIGHKGADLIAPGNTLASFDAALAAGVDMVEFDVLPENPDGSGRLVLAHDFAAAARREPITLEEGLAHFAQDAWEGIELDVDLKTTGYERRVIDALREYGLAERALISTMEEESLRIVREAGAGHPPRLVGAQAAAQLPGQPLHALAGAARRPVRAHGAARARGARDQRGPRRRDHVALGARDPAPGAERSSGRAASSTCGRSTTRRGSPSSARIGVTGVITNDPRLFATA